MSTCSGGDSGSSSAIAVGRGLRAIHDVAQVVRGKLRARAALHDLFFEEESGIDVHDHLGIVDERVLQYGELFLRDPLRAREPPC